VFKRTHVAVRIAGMTPELMEKDEAEISLVKLSCEVNPLTPELAQELHDFVRSTLFTMSGAEVNALLSGAKFGGIAIPPQPIAVRMAPDQKKASFQIDEAKVSNIHAKRSKKSAAWTLGFDLTCSPASDHQLAQLLECYTRTRYLTFAPAAPGLFDETPVASSRGLTSGEVEA
jgi:hypothetical protein